MACPSTCFINSPLSAQGRCLFAKIVGPDFSGKPPNLQTDPTNSHPHFPMEPDLSGSQSEDGSVPLKSGTKSLRSLGSQPSGSSAFAFTSIYIVFSRSFHLTHQKLFTFSGFENGQPSPREACARNPKSRLIDILLEAETERLNKRLGPGVCGVLGTSRERRSKWWTPLQA